MTLLGGRGARPGCHHFRVTPFYDTNQTKNKTTMCLISSKMLITLKWTKNDLKRLLKQLFRGLALICQTYKSQVIKNFDNWPKLSNQF